MVAAPCSRRPLSRGDRGRGVYCVVDGDGNRLLAVGHVQRDVAGRTDLGVELVDEVSGGAPDVVADRFLAGPGVRDPDTTHANMVPGYNLPTAKCKHGKPGTRNTSKQFCLRCLSATSIQ